MEAKTWYSRYASANNAMQYCIKQGLEEMAGNWQEQLAGLIDDLPHGSGIDGDWSHEFKNGKIILNNSFHVMDDAGFYDGWIDFAAVISPSLQFGADVSISGNFGKHQDLKGYLAEIIGEAIEQRQ